MVVFHAYSILFSIKDRYNSIFSVDLVEYVDWRMPDIVTSTMFGVVFAIISSRNLVIGNVKG